MTTKPNRPAKPKRFWCVARHRGQIVVSGAFVRRKYAELYMNSYGYSPSAYSVCECDIAPVMSKGKAKS